MSTPLTLEEALKQHARVDTGNIRQKFIDDSKKRLMQIVARPDSYELSVLLLLLIDNEDGAGIVPTALINDLRALAQAWLDKPTDPFISKISASCGRSY